MRKMTDEDKQKILQQVELFRREKMTFDSEVAKWDDAGNDIIVLAKHMCMIMMEMTDFTRYFFFNMIIYHNYPFHNFFIIILVVVVLSKPLWMSLTLPKRFQRLVPNWIS